jgi:hypothetical protein
LFELLQEFVSIYNIKSLLDVEEDNCWFLLVLASDSLGSVAEKKIFACIKKMMKVY